jgi:hypothetical protein
VLFNDSSQYFMFKKLNYKNGETARFVTRFNNGISIQKRHTRIRSTNSEMGHVFPRNNNETANLFSSRVRAHAQARAHTHARARARKYCRLISRYFNNAFPFKSD